MLYYFYCFIYIHPIRGIRLNLKKAVIAASAVLSVLLILSVIALFTVQREDRVKLLFAVSGSDYDQAAYDNFRQSLAANVTVTLKPLAGLSLNQLEHYDSVYLDYNLKQSDILRNAQSMLIRYVEQGGHLFLENDFAADFPPAFIGASQVVDLPEPADIKFTYPEVDPHLQGMQKTFKLFVDSFASQNAMTDIASGTIRLNALPGYDWGKGIVPSTAQPLVVMNQTAIMAANRYGQGSVLLGSALLPSHYYITGFDLASGMDPAKGFGEMVKQSADNYRPEPGNTYFHFKNEQPVRPYFHFAFAAANYQLRNEYLGYVSKEKLGYSLKKIHGPYGRPAMAYQNHFEAATGFKNEEGIQWAELLKKYNQIPSFSIIRSSFEWATWWENVTVHLNTGTQEKPAFVGQYTNSYYGSGVRLSGGDKPMTLTRYPGQNMHLGVVFQDPYRAYPALADLNGDGKPDLIAGSGDGTLNLFLNQGQNASAYSDQPLPEGLLTPDAFSTGQPVRDTSGGALHVSGYAAPALADLNGDGEPDLIVGDKEGRMWLAWNKGKGIYGPLQPLTDAAQGRAIGTAAAGGYTAPRIADYDGDGTPDLIMGSGSGSVYACRGLAVGDGNSIRFEEAKLLFKHTARFTAPAVRDMNGDGRPDLLIGSENGDVQVYFRQADSSYANQGPVNGQTANQIGTNALVGGHHSVPLWADLNHDGKDDLVVGQLEFSQSIQLDDPDFPYKEQLNRFLSYARDNKLELVPHLFFHSYVSNEQEQREIALHKALFEKLGIPWNHTGTNQHTWRINNTDRMQTLRNENAAGIWYNFGFRPPNNQLDPQYGQDYVWGMPFLLNDGSLKSPMLLNTPIYIYRPKGSEYASEAIYEAYARMDMPIDYFDHIEYKFPDRTGELLPYVEYLDKLRNGYDYNFMTENQMARSFLTTLTAKVTAKQSYGTYWLNRLKDMLGSGRHLNLRLAADVSDVPEELAAEYRNTLGIAIEPGKKYQSTPLGVDSDIYTEREGTLYTGLGRPIKLSVDWKPDPLHLVRSNVPFKLTRSGGSATVELMADGMQQIKLYSPDPLHITGDGLKIERNEAENTYTITHYGAATVVKLDGIR